MNTNISRWGTRQTGRFNKALLPSSEGFYRHELKLRGRGVWRSALCPFHPDHHPSLRINTITGCFRCMVCDARGGDVLEFYRLRTGAGFVEAAKALGAWEDR